MAGRGSYKVGKGAEYRTLQEALDALIEDQGHNEFTREQRIIIEDSGAYGGLWLEADILRPTDTYPLYIEAREGEIPVLDGSLDPGNNNYGIYIGQGLQHVYINRLQIQNYYIGIMVDANSHDITVGRCFVRNNINAGVFAHLSENFIIHDSIVMDGDFCIVSNLCINAAIVHNTLFNSGRLFSGESNSLGCLVVRMAEDFGGGSDDTGYAWIRNNIAVSLANDGFIFQENDLASDIILSNYNCIFAPNGSKYLVLRDRRSQESRRFESLDRIYRSFGVEQNSIGSDPMLFKPVFGTNDIDGYKLDLKTLAGSKAVSAGEQYNPDPPSTLPSWIDYTLFTIDFDNTTRTANRNPTLGAIEADGRYNLKQDPNTVPSFAACDYGAFNEILDNFRMDLWYPRVHDGFFYIREKEYYLYADKQTHKLSDCAVTRIMTPKRIAINKPIGIYIGGVEISSDSYDVAGNYVTIYHKGTNAYSLHTEIEIHASYRKWGSGGFIYSKMVYRTKIGTGKTKFFLPEPAILEGGAPVVITDDKSSKLDTVDSINREFTIRWNEEFGLNEIIFSCNTNVIDNPQFDYYTGLLPLGWHSTTGVSVVGSKDGWLPIAGENICQVSGSPGSYRGISQTVDFALYTGERGALTWTWHSASSDNLDTIWYIDFLSDQGVTVSSLSGIYTSDNTWNRYRCVIGDVDHTLSGLSVGSVRDVTGGIALPEDSVAVRLGLIVHDYGDLYIDSVQLEEGFLHSEYNRLPQWNDLTVEYEGSASGFYTVKDLAIAPVRNPNHNGFLMIQGVPARQFDDYAPDGASTLEEYKWTKGRLGVIPWSRLTGRDKMVFRVVPGLEDGHGNTLKDPHVDTPRMTTITIDPERIQSLQGSNGSRFYVEAYDQYNNPSSFEDLTVQVYDYAGEYPGVLRREAYSVPIARGVNMTQQTDNAGKVDLIWVPPDASDIMYVGQIPSRQGDEDAYVDVDYRVSLSNYGNITIQNYTGQYLATDSDETITGAYPLQHFRGDSYISLPLFPVYDSVEVIYNNEKWTESKSYQPGNKEFQVLYRTRTIKMAGTFNGRAQVRFKKKLAWVRPEWGRRIFLHGDLLSGQSGDIAISYDAELLMQATNNDGLSVERSLIAQNPRKIYG